jgi:hypothetical protein
MMCIIPQHHVSCQTPLGICSIDLFESPRPPNSHQKEEYINDRLDRADAPQYVRQQRVLNPRRLSADCRLVQLGVSPSRPENLRIRDDVTLNDINMCLELARDVRELVPETTGHPVKPRLQALKAIACALDSIPHNFIGFVDCCVEKMAELSVTIEKATSHLLVSVYDLGELPLITKANVNCQHVM